MNRLKVIALSVCLPLAGLTACQQKNSLDFEEIDFKSDVANTESVSNAELGSAEDNANSPLLTVASAKINDAKDLPKTSKLRPPVDIEYELLGTPQLGQPLDIRLIVSSSIPNLPIEVKYQSLEPSAMSIMPRGGNVSQSFRLMPNAEGIRETDQTITLVPQQFGRAILTVVAEMEGPDGIISTSQAIAIRVGNGAPDKKVNGVLSTDEDGGAIVSMPAD